jgi:hypothetical protein
MVRTYRRHRESRKRTFSLEVCVQGEAKGKASLLSRVVDLPFRATITHLIPFPTRTSAQISPDLQRLCAVNGPELNYGSGLGKTGVDSKVGTSTTV